jgi:hypothetical protein
VQTVRSDSYVDPDSPQGVRAELERLFDGVRGATFEYGEESDFGRRLEQILRSRGLALLDALKSLLFHAGAVPHEAAMEALAVIGRAAGEPSSDARSEFLVAVLLHPSPGLRDSAGLALLDLDHHAAGPAVRRAADAEPDPLAKKNLDFVASELGA